MKGGITADDKKATRFPIMNWHAGYGPELAEQLISHFSAYRAVSNISLYMESNVTAIKRNGAQLSLNAGKDRYCFDVIILASGFGPERGASNTTNDSFHLYRLQSHFP